MDQQREGESTQEDYTDYVTMVEMKDNKTILQLLHQEVR